MKLPNSPESEQACIAYVLRNPTQYKRLADIVKPHHFYWQPFKWAWEAMGIIEEKGLKLDILTLTDELERADKLKEFCISSGSSYGRAGLSQLRDISITDGGESYAATVLDYAAKREIYGILSKGATQTLNGRPAADVISDLESELGNIPLYHGKAISHTLSMTDATEHAIEATHAAARGERAITTGLTDLDKILLPQRTELISIAARPGKGKSSLCNTIAINAARSGQRVKFFVLEMGHVQVTQRLLASMADLDASLIMRGRLMPSDWEKLETAQSELVTLPLTLCDLPAISIGQIRTEARRSDLDVIILDYLQLARADSKNERRDLDIGEITRGLVALAMELDIPIFAAVQMNRMVEARGEKRPNLGDLADSSSIEKDSSSVVFIHETDNGQNTELIIEKHRNGAIGSCPVYFSRKSLTFKDAVQTVRDFS